MTKEEIEWIRRTKTSGHCEDGTPWLAVPNMPNGRSFSVEEILEALRANEVADK